MKQGLALLFVLMLAGTAIAQDETLLGNDIESGGYGGPAVKYGKVTGEDGVWVGGQGGWVINHKLVLGGGGFGLANQVRVEDSDCRRLGLGYGGFLVEYIIASRKLVHASVQGIIGAGGITYTYTYDDTCHGVYYTYDSDAFFAFEPGAYVMLNLHRHVRLGLGASYLYVAGLQYRGLRDSDVRGAMAQMIIKFGLF